MGPGMFAVTRQVAIGMVLICLGLLTGKSYSQTGQEKDLARILGIQRALGEGRDAIARGDFTSAVNSLERQLGNIKGDKEFLAVLGQAYQGHALALQQSGKNQEAETFSRRLRILESGLEKSPQESSVAGLSVPALTSITKDEGGHSSSLGARLNLGAPKIEVVGAVPVVPGQPLEAIGSNSMAGKNIQFRGNLDDQPRPKRGVLESNPFAWENSEDMHQVRATLATADEAFGKGEYERALNNYTQAWQKNPKLPQDVKERWAYCRVHALTSKANRMGASKGFAAEFTREVSQVKALTGKFDAYLVKLREGISPDTSVMGGADSSSFSLIAVSHDPQPAGGWNVAHTQHFRVFHKLEKSSADRVAQMAEQTRVVQGRRWFGERAVGWETKCDLYVHATGSEYSQATGVPPSSPGHSTVKVESGKVSHRRIDLHSDDPNMLEGVLPHETTHVVLAGNLGSSLVPRWADEGMSVLSEPQDRIERHTRQMAKLNQDGTLFPLKQLLELRDYPDQGRVGAFYAQSVSVVQFLTSLKGHQVFAQFLKDGMAGGYESALRTHYGVQDWREMDQAWRANAVNGGSMALR